MRSEGDSLDLCAQLAIRSKNSGDSQEYRVLNYSPGALELGDFTAIFTGLSAGSASSSAARSDDDLPVACGTYQKSGEVYLTVIRQERTSLKDSRGRAVVAYCCACVPYSELERTPAAYVDIAAAIPRHDALREGDLPRSLRVQPLDADWLQVYAEIIDRVGYEFCATVASWALDGGVALMRGLHLGAQRLVYLEAIAGLLPYGGRADLSFSTWMESASAHSIRLGFSNQARPQEKRIVWGDAPPTGFRPGSAGEQYYHLLLDLKQIDAGWRYSTREVVSYLAEHRQPLNFENPECFVQVLYALNQPYLVWKAVKAGRGDIQQVSDLLRSDNSRTLSEGQQVDLLLFLLANPEISEDDVRILKASWREELWPGLIAAALSQVRTDSHPEACERLLALADEKGRLSDFLYDVLQAVITEIAPLSGPDATQQVRSVATLLLSSWPRIASDTRTLRPVQGVLSRYPPLLFELVFEAGRRSGGTLETILDQLGRERVLRDNLRTFEIARGRVRDSVSGTDIARLASCNPQYVPDLVDIALSRGAGNGLEGILTGVLGWLSTDPRVTSWDQEWGPTLDRLAALDQTSAQVVALVDLCYLLLAAGTSLPFLGAALDDTSGSFHLYMDALIGGIQRLGENARMGLVEAITADDCRSVQRAENSLHLLDRLLDDSLVASRRDTICRRVLSIVDQYPRLLDSDVFARLEAPLTKSGYALPVAERRLKQSLQSSTPPDRAAEQCARLVEAHGIKAVQVIIRMLNDRQYLDTVERFTKFRESLADKLRNRTPPQVLLALDRALEQAVLNGELAPNLSERYASYFIHELFSRLDGDVSDLARVGKHLTEEDLHYLSRLITEIQEIDPRLHKGLMPRLRWGR